MNQSLENKFIKFTDDYLETHNVLPKYNEIKTFYDSLPNIESHFKASKGWFEKFMLRNYHTSPRYHYKKNWKRDSSVQQNSPFLNRIGTSLFENVPKDTSYQILNLSKLSDHELKNNVENILQTPNSFPHGSLMEEVNESSWDNGNCFRDSIFRTPFEPDN